MSGRDAAAMLPSALRERLQYERFDGPFGEIPVMLAHPAAGWQSERVEPAPICLWLHGRTANKELDPGRYLRWVRGGIAACAIDLPGHGERLDEARQGPEATMGVVRQMFDEIDHVVRALAERFSEKFDLSRMAIGGMSAGGMATLRRLCEPHGFQCAAVEATTGRFEGMKGRGFYREDLVADVEPERFIDRWPVAIPMLVLHSEKDAWINVDDQRGFVEKLRARYERMGADPAIVEMKTWPETGAPYEHIGFGKVSNDAKNLQTEFLQKWLSASSRPA